MSRLADAAARYCEAKDRERALLDGMFRCEDFAHGELGEPPVDYCSRRTKEPRPHEEDYGGEPIDQDEWCEPCRANLPAVDELRKIRRRLPGLMSAMRRAHRAALSARTGPRDLASASLDASHAGRPGAVLDGGAR